MSTAFSSDMLALPCFLQAQKVKAYSELPELSEEAEESALLLLVYVEGGTELHYTNIQWNVCFLCLLYESYAFPSQDRLYAEYSFYHLFEINRNKDSTLCSLQTY